MQDALGKQQPSVLARLAGTGRSNLVRDIELLHDDGSVDKVWRGGYCRRINGAEDDPPPELPLGDSGQDY